MKHKHYNEIVAWAGGKQIQFKSHRDDTWRDCINNPLWQEEYEYRIKPDNYVIRKNTWEFLRLNNDIKESQEIDFIIDGSTRKIIDVKLVNKNE